MTEIIPAIIAHSFEDLKDKMARVEGIAPIVQIDACDGQFVRSESWPYKGDREDDFKRLIEEDEGFPFWETLDFEIHLMVKDPETVAESWIKAGAKRVLMHVESSENLLEFVKRLRTEYGYPGEQVANVEIGIVLNVSTPIDTIYAYLDKNEDGKSLADVVQFMGIRHIGYQGEPFAPEILEKIKALREKYPEVIISVDGGVNFETAKSLVEAGANRLVSGSAIYDSNDVAEAIEELKNS